MKTTARVGSIIDISIRRADGKIEHIGKIHNVIGEFASTTSRQNPSGNISFHARNAPGVELLSGTFSQSGTTITRVTGSYDLTGPSLGDLLVFSSGERAYINTKSTSSATVSKSQTVAATTLTRYKTNSSGFGGYNPSSLSSQDLTNQAATNGYSNGVISRTLNSVPAIFTPAASPYTLHCIPVTISTTTATSGSFFDLPAPVAIGIGDSIVINSFEYRLTFDEFQPRAFAVSPLSGVTASGRVQRLRRVTDSDSGAPTRIFLLTDANKITLPDMLGPAASYINPTSLTILETITASGSSTVATTNNNNTDSNTCFGTVTTGGTVKQILWGSTTQLWGVVEFDTPQSIAAGKVITIGSSLQMEVELP